MPIIFGCQKFSLKVFLSICLIFCQFQPGGAYKSAAFLKQACSEAYCRKASLMLRVSQNTSIQIKLFILPLKKIVEKQLIIAQLRGEISLKKLILREKCLQEIAPDKSPLPENSLQGIKLPFRKFRLYFRPNMIG